MSHCCMLNQSHHHPFHFSNFHQSQQPRFQHYHHWPVVHIILHARNHLEDHVKQSLEETKKLKCAIQVMQSNNEGIINF